MTEPKAAGWRCPRCGRRFKQRTREHSCDIRSLGAHVDRASPEVKQIVDIMLATLDGFGPHAVVPLKTMIVMRAGSNFAGLVVRRETVEVSFIVRRMLNNPRIHKTERLGPAKYAHSTRLTAPADFDAQLAKWLREAYDGVTLSAVATRARKK